MTRARGHLRFDRRFSTLGVTRLQRSSGTSDPVKFAALNELLTTIAKASEAAPVIKAFATELISIEELRLAESEAGLRILAATCRQRLAVAQSDRGRGNIREEGDTAPSALTDIDGRKILNEILPPRVSDSKLVQKPLWATALEEIIPSLDVKRSTARRYSTSIRALRAKAGACRLAEETFELLADLSDSQWQSLEAFRTHGITLTELADLASMPRALRQQTLRRRRVRIGPELIDRIEGISPEQLNALAVGGDYILGSEHAVALQRLTSAERSELRELAARLGENALVRDLALISKRQWRLLANGWGASAADWNHVRRAMSAVLTKLFHDDAQHRFRQHVINCIPLLHEAERVPDIAPATLWRIMEHLPEYARKFPLFLVVTGLRVSEYDALERVHLLPETYRIQVPGTKTDASEAEIAVAPDCWEFVDVAVPAPFRYAWMRREWKKACEAAGVSGITLHDLRHCHGQWAIDAGVAEHEVQAQLRHKSIAMTRRYVRARDARRSANAAGRALLDAKHIA